MLSEVQFTSGSLFYLNTNAIKLHYDEKNYFNGRDTGNIFNSTGTDYCF